MKPVAAAPAAAARQKTLLFTMQEQAGQNWCWAAVAASVSAYYGVAPVQTQYQVASAVLGTDCGPPIPAGADIVSALDNALEVSHHFCPQTPRLAQALDFAAIVTEIEGGRPIGCEIDWNDGSGIGHFNVIAGYCDDSQQDVAIFDPSSIYGNHLLPLASFTSNYHGGAWKASYPTMRIPG